MRCTSDSSLCLPFALRSSSSSKATSKWSSIARLARPVISTTSSMPDETASSTTYWISGLSTSGSISFGEALVAGRNRVPRPAAGKTAFVISFAMPISWWNPKGRILGYERPKVKDRSADALLFRHRYAAHEVLEVVVGELQPGADEGRPAVDVQNI